jgi:hypothetical protein
MKPSIAAAMVTALLTALPAAAQAQVVGRVAAVARPAHYQGPCPARIEFTGTIFVNHPTSVTYRWERSDRGTGPVQTVFIRGGGLGVGTSWQLGAPGRVMDGYQTLHVLSPVDLYSNPANFSVACR